MRAAISRLIVLSEQDPLLVRTAILRLMFQFIMMLELDAKYVYIVVPSLVLTVLV